MTDVSARNDLPAQILVKDKHTDLIDAPIIVQDDALAIVPLPLSALTRTGLDDTAFDFIDLDDVDDAGLHE